MSVTVQDLPSVASYGTNLGDISRAFMNYSAMAMAQRINELQALGGLPGNTVDVFQAISERQTMFKNIIKARNDLDRVSVNHSTVISGGALSDGTPIQFNAASLDAMDRVLGAYLTQLLPYMTTPPPNTPAPLSRSYIRRSPMVGVLRWPVTCESGSAAQVEEKKHNQADWAPPAQFAVQLGKEFPGLVHHGIESIRSRGDLPGLDSEPDSNLLDSISAVAGGMSGMLGFYSQTLEGPKAYPAGRRPRCWVRSPEVRVC